MREFSFGGALGKAAANVVVVVDDGGGEGEDEEDGGEDEGSGLRPLTTASTGPGVTAKPADGAALKPWGGAGVLDSCGVEAPAEADAEDDTLWAPEGVVAPVKTEVAVDVVDAIGRLFPSTRTRIMTLLVKRKEIKKKR